MLKGKSIKIRGKKHSQPLWYFTHSNVKIANIQGCKMNETTQMLKNLGRRIAYLRKQQGMSQEDFAEASGKMINTISNIERGLSDPKISTLLSISNALNTSIEELFSESQENPTEKELPSNILAIIQILKKQDDKTLQVIQKQIEALLELV